MTQQIKQKNNKQDNKISRETIIWFLFFLGIFAVFAVGIWKCVEATQNSIDKSYLESQIDLYENNPTKINIGMTDNITDLMTQKANISEEYRTNLFIGISGILLPVFIICSTLRIILESYGVEFE